MPALTRSAKKRQEQEQDAASHLPNAGISQQGTLVITEPTPGGGTHTRWLRGEAAQQALLTSQPPAVDTAHAQPLQAFTTPAHLIIGQPTTPPPIQRARRKASPNSPKQEPLGGRGGYKDSPKNAQPNGNGFPSNQSSFGRKLKGGQRHPDRTQSQSQEAEPTWCAPRPLAPYGHPPGHPGNARPASLELRDPPAPRTPSRDAL